MSELDAVFDLSDASDLPASIHHIRNERKGSPYPMFTLTFTKHILCRCPPPPSNSPHTYTHTSETINTGYLCESSFSNNFLINNDCRLSYEERLLKAMFLTIYVKVKVIRGACPILHNY